MSILQLLTDTVRVCASVHPMQHLPCTTPLQSEPTNRREHPFVLFSVAWKSLVPGQA